MSAENQAPQITTYPCKNCGGGLHYKPGSDNMSCPYCGTRNTIADAPGEVVERDLLAALEKHADAAEAVDVITVACQSCGAETVLAPNTTAGECAFCGDNISAQAHSAKAVKPESLLPFKVDLKTAGENFRQWLKKRWFMPNKAKKYSTSKKLRGVYTPYWTFDARTDTTYTGQRGDYYYTTETYTETVDGKTVTKTRQVRHTRWSHASGRVRNHFDDVLVVGSRSVPEKIAEKLEPWDLQELKPFAEEYTAGFTVESYSVPLDQAFAKGQRKMEPEIDRTIRRDIGGDEQRIHSRSISWSDLSYKHLLLPVWIGAFHFKNKIYQYLVNARTGEVQGQRPYSWVKILFFSLAMAAVAAGIVFLVMFLADKQ